MKDFFSFLHNKGAPKHHDRNGKAQFKPIMSRKNPLHSNAFRPQSFVSRARKNTSVLNEIRQESNHSQRSFQGRKSREDLSFSFSIPLLPALCIVFLAAFLVLSNGEIISSLLYRDVVTVHSLEDSGGKHGMVNYAGINPVEIVNRPEVSGSESSAGSPKTISNDNAVNDVISEQINNEPIPLKMVEYFAWENYTVKRGDSVSKIAVDHGLSYDAVIASNDLTNAHLLYVGQTLRLPNMNGIPYVIKQGDTLTKISRNWNIPLEVLADVNNIERDLLIQGQLIFLPGAKMPARDLKLALGTLFIYPLKGTGARETSSFGWRKDPFTGVQRLHEAMDWAVNVGTPVKAASEGKVAKVGLDAGYGKYIILSHSENFETLYAHLSVTSVKEGDKVDQGTKIGEVGNTGRSTGSHLHFALYRNRRAVDPLDFLSF